MFTKVFIAVGLLLAGFLIYASMLPDTFEVKRSLDINATAAQVYGNLNNFRRWEGWSPWEKLDPAMERTFDGPDSGIGAVYTWKGNDKVGKGNMEITAATIPTRLEIAIDFIEPFPASNTVEFSLDEQNEHTLVTWTMRGNHNKLGKLMSAFMDMDATVGADFEQGLVNLKAVTETQANAVPKFLAPAPAP